MPAKSVLSAALLALLFMTAGFPPVRAQVPDSGTVQLKCKLQDDPVNHKDSYWLVELCNAAGAPLRKVLRMAGDTFRFKDLSPGVYRLHISGKGGRSNSESIDLTPKPDQKSAEFTKELALPNALAAKDHHQVHVRSLAVPKEAAAEMQRSEQSQLDNDQRGALDHLKRAVEIYPSYVAAWNNIGTFHHRKGEYDDAVRSFTRAVELDPDFAVGWVNLAGSLLAAGRFSEAVEASTRGLKAGASDAVANSQAGLSFYYTRDFRKAQVYLRRVLDVDPGFVPAPQLYLAQIAISEKAWADAVRYLEGYLSLHPNAPDAEQVRRSLALAMENDKKF